jgi:hypothetical protein
MYLFWGPAAWTHTSVHLMGVLVSQNGEGKWTRLDGRRYGG